MDEPVDYRAFHYSSTYALSSDSKKPPEPRTQHTSTVIGNTMYVIGGKNPETDEYYYSLHVLDLKGTSMYWSKPRIGGDLIPALCGHTAVAFGKRIFVFGGRNPKVAFNDIYMLNTSTVAWTRFKSTPQDPPPRYLHSATIIPDQKSFIVFGGINKGRVYNDVYVCDVDNLVWSQVGTINAPSGRHSHSAAIHNNNLIVFGGSDASDNPTNDLYLLSLRSWVWKKVDTTGDPPPPLSLHSAVTVSNFMLVSGGWLKSSEISDGYYFLDMDGFIWIPADFMKKKAASPRFGHTTNYLKRRIFIIGGNSGSKERETKTYTISTLEKKDGTISKGRSSSRHLPSAKSLHYSDTIPRRGSPRAHLRIKDQLRLLRELVESKIVDDAEETFMKKYKKIEHKIVRMFDDISENSHSRSSSSVSGDSTSSDLTPKGSNLSVSSRSPEALSLDGSKRRSTLSITSTSPLTTPAHSPRAGPTPITTVLPSVKMRNSLEELRSSAKSLPEDLIANGNHADEAAMTVQRNSSVTEEKPKTNSGSILQVGQARGNAHGRQIRSRSMNGPIEGIEVLHQMLQKSSSANQISIANEQLEKIEEQYRNSAIREILETEQTFANDMKVVQKVFITPMQAWVAPEDITAIFSNIGEIAAVSAEFSQKLAVVATKSPDKQNIGEVFVSMMPYLKVLLVYCGDQGNTRGTIANLKARDEKFAQLIDKAITIPECRLMELDSFLIKPLQRATRYPLLLSALMKHTSPKHPDYNNITEAHQAMQALVQEANERKRTNENSAKIATMVSKIVWIGDKINLIQPGRQLVAENSFPAAVSKTLQGEIKVDIAKRLRIIVFTDFLLVVREKKKGIFDWGDVQEKWVEVCRIQLHETNCWAANLEEIQLKNDGSDCDPDTIRKYTSFMFQIVRNDPPLRVVCAAETELEKEDWRRMLANSIAHRGSILMKQAHRERDRVRRSVSLNQLMANSKPKADGNVVVVTKKEEDQKDGKRMSASNGVPLSASPREKTMTEKDAVRIVLAKSPDQSPSKAPLASATEHFTRPKSTEQKRSPGELRAWMVARTNAQIANSQTDVFTDLSKD